MKNQELAILSVNNDNVTSVEMEDSFDYDLIVPRTMKLVSFYQKAMALIAPCILWPDCTVYIMTLKWFIEQESLKFFESNHENVIGAFAEVAIYSY